MNVRFFKNHCACMSLVGMLALASFAPTNAYATGIPVVDIAAIVQAIIQELNQLDQLAEARTQTLQQLEDYELALTNSQQLPGPVRAEIESRVRSQLNNNVHDFGISNINTSTTLDPNANTYYSNADAVIRQSIGATPSDPAAVNAGLAAVGIANNDPSTIRQQQIQDHEQYQRVLDDMRQVALTRQNAENRSAAAGEVTSQMANLGDNNTVGAIQLLGAQNSLQYAQQEDLLKTQAAILKNMQESQARELAGRQKLRQIELDRLQKALNEPNRAN